ncbi:MAG TPA: uroporphyrinogen decarboxylase family protein [archaeon]|nr:uroporphyrinogen decarboxylase family protein [archaeon]
MTELDNMLATLSGEHPSRFPYCPMGHWNRRACKKLLPPECFDDNIYSLPHERFDSFPRRPESRMAAVNYARFMGLSTLGCGKGGPMPFGHGGPGEIIGWLEKRQAGNEIYRFEGGSTRLVRYDPYSVQYGHSFPILEPEDLERLELPDPTDPARWVDIEPDSASFTGAGIMPAGKIMGFFSGIHNNFYDFQKLMINLIDNPGFVHRLTARLAEWSLAAAEEMLKRGVCMIEVCDDLGTPEGMLISPAMFTEFFLPWYRKLFELCHSYHSYVHMHSHGNIAAIIPLLLDAGVDILNPFDPKENRNLEELVERFSDRVVFCGFIPSDYYLLQKDEEIEILFRRAASLGRKCKRGYIIMEHGFPEELSVERFRFILGLVDKYRKTD